MEELGIKLYGEEIGESAASSAYLTLLKKFSTNHNHKLLLEQKVPFDWINSLKIKRYDPQDGSMGQIYTLQITHDHNFDKGIQVNYETYGYHLTQPQTLLELIKTPQEQKLTEFQNSHKKDLKFLICESWMVYADCIYPTYSSAELYFKEKIIKIERKPNNRGTEYQNQIINLNF